MASIKPTTSRHAKDPEKYYTICSRMTTGLWHKPPIYQLHSCN